MVLRNIEMSDKKIFSLPIHVYECSILGIWYGGGDYDYLGRDTIIYLTSDEHQIVLDNTKDAVGDNVIGVWRDRDDPTIHVVWSLMDIVFMLSVIF